VDIKAFISISEKTLDLPVGFISYLKLNPPITEQNFEDIFRNVLDHCYSKSVIMNIPEDVFIICNDVDLLQEIRSALKHIFQDEEKPEHNRMIEFWKKRSIVAKIEGIP
jgi:hypothetical protein